MGFKTFLSQMTFPMSRFEYNLIASTFADDNIQMYSHLMCYINRFTIPEGRDLYSHIAISHSVNSQTFAATF
jgi:hypothetical protein